MKLKTVIVLPFVRCYRLLCTPVNQKIHVFCYAAVLVEDNHSLLMVSESVNNKIKLLMFILCVGFGGG